MPDRPTLRLVGFAAGLLVVLVAGFTVGRWAGPTSPSAGSGAGMPMGAASDGHDHAHGGPASGAGSGVEVGGLAVAASGYTLVPESTEFRAGVAQPLRFRVDGPDRKPVTQFTIAHDKPLHLIVVRRDLSGYQHLHPTMAPDGTWQIPLTLPTAGTWRAYADFTTPTVGAMQAALTLGVDLTVAGSYQPAALPAPARQSTVDGLSVTYEGTPTVGSAQPFLFHVPGQVERYLGAYGHLVVLREGDLGYVHVHPEDQLSAGAVKFWLAAPSPGRYRMFFDFQLAGVVHTATYTLDVP